MENNITVVLVDDKAQDFTISIERIGPNLYRVNANLYGHHLAMPYPLMPTERAMHFKKLWYHLKQNPNDKTIKVNVLNHFFGEELFDTGDPLDVIEIILQVLRQQVISTHYIDKSTGLPIKPRCIHQAEQLLDVPSDPMVILDKAGKPMKQIKITEEAEPCRSPKQGRKLMI